MDKITNFSKLIKDDIKPINLNPLAPKWPFRMLCIGSSGSGKTNMMIDLILKHIHFDKIYVFRKDETEKLYEFLQKFLDKCKKRIEKETCLEIGDIIKMSNKFEDLPNIDDLDLNLQTLIIFDDFITQKDQSKVEELFLRGRKKNTSIIYITQSYFKVPDLIRENCGYYAIFDIAQKNQLRALANTHSTRISFDKFMELFKEIKKTPYNFMLIDKVSKDLPMHIRSGWTGLLTEYD